MVPSIISPYQVSCSLRSKDDTVVQQVLQLLEAEKMIYGVQNYDIVGTTIEDIFLDLMGQERSKPVSHRLRKRIAGFASSDTGFGSEEQCA